MYFLKLIPLLLVVSCSSNGVKENRDSANFDIEIETLGEVSDSIESLYLIPIAAGGIEGKQYQKYAKNLFLINDIKVLNDKTAAKYFASIDCNISEQKTKSQTNVLPLSNRKTTNVKDMYGQSVGSFDSSTTDYATVTNQVDYHKRNCTLTLYDSKKFSKGKDESAVWKIVGNSEGSSSSMNRIMPAILAAFSNSLFASLDHSKSVNIPEDSELYIKIKSSNEAALVSNKNSKKCRTDSECKGRDFCLLLEADKPGVCTDNWAAKMMFKKNTPSAQDKSGCMKDSDCSEDKMCATVRGEYPGSCAKKGWGF
jgi:hypothetical protein